jgi:hypothetical protein
MRYQFPAINVKLRQVRLRRNYQPSRSIQFSGNTSRKNSLASLLLFILGYVPLDQALGVLMFLGTITELALVVPCIDIDSTMK